MENPLVTSTISPVVFTPEKIDLIKRQIALGASDDEIELFIYQCQRTGLDPFARQIHAVMRSTKIGPKLSIQTSIDGFRLIAERSGHYAGQVGPLWCGADGVWRDSWLASTPPSAAKVGVLRNDFSEPLVAVAKFESYAQTYYDKDSRKYVLSLMWAKMPEIMIAKCAEALALRRAFPQELSGLHTGDEMGQETNEPSVITPVVVEKPKGDFTKASSAISAANSVQLGAIIKSLDQRKWTEQELSDLTEMVNVRSRELAEVKP